MKGYNRPERRKHKRLDVNFITICRASEAVNVDILMGNEEFPALIVDLSDGGVALESEYHVPLGIYFAIKFVLIDAIKGEKFKLIAVRAKVCYSMPAEDGSQRMGLKFVRLSIEDRAAIRHFISISC